MSRIVLATLNAKFVHSSLALRYLRATVEAQHEVQLLEFTIHDPVERILGSIYEACPDVIGFSCYIWNIEETCRLLSMIRKVLPHVLLILGGPEVSYDTEQYMERLDAVDVIVIGEGEEAFSELLEKHSAQKSYDSVRGLCIRDSRGKVVRTGSRSKVAQLDSIPSPYPDRAMQELHNRIVYFEASRGCPFSCQFCLSSIESGVRYFSLARVKQDLRKLIDAGVRQIKFVDRTFNLRKEYALEIFSYLIASPGQTTFHFEITGDILKSDIVAWLCEHAPAGLFRFEIGVQSTNDATNDIVQRRQDFLKLAQTVRSIAQSGAIVQHLDLIAGLPEEDYTRFAQTFNDVFALQPDELQLGFLKLLRGTGLRSMADRYGYVYMDTAPYEMLSNSKMSFDDVLQLKRLEDILEKYYNSNRFSHTVRYATKVLFSSAFTFFQEFGNYWNANGWSRIGHQQLDLVKHLEEFLIYSSVYDDTVKSLLRADYLLHEKMRPRSLWWEQSYTRRTSRHIAVEAGSLDPPLPQELSATELNKRTVVDFVPLQAWLALSSESPGISIEEGKEYGDREVEICYVYHSTAGYPTMHRVQNISLQEVVNVR